ncbi:MAG: radical SAM protein [Arenimonas sp.]|nr:radical SAM protein [Arenimonas sp.]
MTESQQKKIIRHLEIHVVHSCNLACEGCSHYSDQGHKGILSLSEADQWMQLWSQRLRPKQFSLLGGEPTIHPDLTGFVLLARKHWPDAHLRLVTNGFFLHRYPNLPAILQNDPNATIYLSVHHNSPEYKEKLKPVFKLLDTWVHEYGIRVEYYQSFKHWTRRYHGIGKSMQPFHDQQPRQSWEQCPARYCPQLFEGKIWKCAPLAYLKMQDAKFGLSEDWQPYLNYQALQASCNDEQLTEFFSREEESACGMCPAKPEKFELPMPLKSISVRSAVNI